MLPELRGCSLRLASPAQQDRSLNLAVLRGGWGGGCARGRGGAGEEAADPRLEGLSTPGSGAGDFLLLLVGGPTAGPARPLRPRRWGHP